MSGRSALTRVQRAEEVLVGLEKAFVVLALSLMLLINVGQVAGRHLRFDDLGKWTDLLLALLPWLGMIGASIGVRQSRHIGFHSLRAHSPIPVRRLMQSLAAVAMIGFFAVMIVSGFQAVHDQYVIGGSSPQLEIPRWTVTAAVPVGGTLMAIHAVMGILRELTERSQEEIQVVTDTDMAEEFVSQP
jgi:TRAP-type C4-dicarboxylate transport system permease small subunit